VKSVVLDASAVLAWLLPTQATEAASALLAGSDDAVFEAPTIFEWEVYNVLVGMTRRGLLTGKQYEDAVAALCGLQIRLHQPMAPVGPLADLARDVRLSLFDTSYFVLALDRGWPLASRDEALLAAAASKGVACFDLRAPIR
jgi:predicted nucleic acid-binding protein